MTSFSMIYNLYLWVNNGAVLCDYVTVWVVSVVCYTGHHSQLMEFPSETKNYENLLWTHCCQILLKSWKSSSENNSNLNRSKSTLLSIKCKMFKPEELWIFGQGICPKSTVFKKLFGWNGMKSFNARIEWIHSNNQVCKYWNIIICMMNLTSV